MKNLLKNIKKVLFVLLFFNFGSAQTTIVDVDGGFTPQDLPAGTYLKDINNTFTKFIGTWKWEMGNKILIFKIEKVTQYLYTEYGVYADFIVGYYSYTENGGISYLINTIPQNGRGINPNLTTLYTSGVENQQSCSFVYRDALIQKTNCTAKFKFLPNSTTQVKLQLLNSGLTYLLPDLLPNPDFSIPNNIILTKQ